MRIGLIGGSGLYDIEGLNIAEEISLSTPFGSPSSAYKIGRIHDVEIAFLARHVLNSIGTVLFNFPQHYCHPIRFIFSVILYLVAISFTKSS